MDLYPLFKQATEKHEVSNGTTPYHKLCKIWVVFHTIQKIMKKKFRIQIISYIYFRNPNNYISLIYCYCQRKKELENSKTNF